MKVAGLTNNYDPDAGMTSKNNEPIITFNLGIALGLGIDVHIEIAPQK